MTRHISQRAYEKVESDEFREIPELHRDVDTANGGTTQSTAHPLAKPIGWEQLGLEVNDLFHVNGAKTVELRGASNLDSGTTKDLTFQVWGWPYDHQEDNDAHHFSAGMLLLDTGVAPGGATVPDVHPFTGEATQGTTWYMVDQEDTRTYPANASNNIATYPTTASDAAGQELRFLIDVQGMKFLYVLIDGTKSNARVAIALRRVA